MTVDPTATPPQQPLDKLRVRQSESWKRGTPESVESLLDNSLGRQLDDEGILELILAEDSCRRSRGEAPNVSEYVQRFPALANRLDRLFALQSLLGSAALSASTAAPFDLKQMTESDVKVELSPERPPFHLPAVGDRVGQYELQALVGQGGMGAVFRARHLRLGKTVAIKFLLPRLAPTSEQITRFERETKTLGKLHHPNILHALDAGEDRGIPFLVTEYLAGIDLSKWVRQHGPMSDGDACRVIRETALGLAHAHEHGVVHRDVKPSNVLLLDSGGVKLLDLGLARVVERVHEDVDGTTLTVSGQLLGTPDYMSPEQWEESSEIDARTDLYSLGCTLFYLLTGRAPFEDATHTTYLRKMHGHRLESMPDVVLARRSALSRMGVQSRSEDLPQSLIDVLRRLTAKKAADRFASAASLAESLQPLASPAETAFRSAVMVGVGLDHSPALPTTRPFSRERCGPSVLRSKWVLILATLATATSGITLTLKNIPARRPSAPPLPSPSVAASANAPLRPDAPQNDPQTTGLDDHGPYTPQNSGMAGSADSQSVDLLKVFRTAPPQSLPAGWSTSRGELVSRAGIDVNNLKMDVTTGNHYRVQCRFTGEDAYDALYIVLPIAGRHCLFAVFAYPDKATETAWAGFSEIAGRPLLTNGAGRRLPMLRQHVPHDVEIQLDSDGQRAHLVGMLDGVEISRWTGPVDQLSLSVSYQWPEKSRFGLGTVNSVWRIHSLQIRQSVDR